MDGIRGVTAGVPASLKPAGINGPTQSADFRQLLFRSIQEVNSMQSEADQAVERLMLGEEITPAEVLTAVQKADIAFKLMMQIRNKLVQAYMEIQNIRV